MNQDTTLLLAAQLRVLPAQADAALVLRHAEREAIPPGTFGQDVPLTARGVASAEELGATLAASGWRLYATASPVPRCADTAKAILRGADRAEGAVALDWRLGDPGPFVVDTELSGPLFLERSPMEIVQRQLTNAEPPAGMRTTSDGVGLLLALTAAGLRSSGRLNVYVTHDAILAVLVAYLYGQSVEETGWPEYLDGLLLWHEGGRLWFAWRGLCRVRASSKDCEARQIPALVHLVEEAKSMIPNSKTIAILIDGDNAQPSLIEHVIAEAGKYGLVTTRRIYGDWTSPQMNSWKTALQSHAVQPIQQFRYTTGKNATDSSLIIDAMDLLHGHTVDGFCIVSSDSDYTRLATRIREQGLFVMGIGRNLTPKAFVNACLVFVYTENLVPKQEKPSVATPPTSADWVNKAAQAIEATMQEDGWAFLGAVGNSLRQLDPAFDPRTYGHKQLSLLIKSRSDLFELRESNSGGASVVDVRLRQNGNGHEPPAM